MKENSEKFTKKQVLKHLKLILTDEQVSLNTVKRMVRKIKKNQIRPILVKFKDYPSKRKSFIVENVI